MPSGVADPGSTAIRQLLLRRQRLHRDQVCALLPAVRAMNRDYRIPAAHADIVTMSTWVAGRGAILDSSSGILDRLVRAVGLPGRPPGQPPLPR